MSGLGGSNDVYSLNNILSKDSKWIESKVFRMIDKISGHTQSQIAIENPN